MSFLDDLILHYNEVTDTLSKGEPGKKARSDLKSIEKKIDTSFPMLSTNPADSKQALNDIINSVGFGTIKTVHGSPHKFRKFKDEAIGSGEGHAAKGRGHYTGKNVNALDNWYRKRLSKGSQPGYIVASEWRDNPANKDLYNKLNLANAERIYGKGHTSSPYLEGASPSTYNQLNRMARSKGINPYLKGSDLHKIYNDLHPPSKGYTYQTELMMEPEDMLHFDKLLDEHPKGVQKQFQAYREGVDAIADYQGFNPDGGDLYRDLAKTYGKEEASKMLQKSGIKGHSFLGQGGKGKPNYVVYDPNDIKIHRRIKDGLESPSKQARKSLLDWTE